MLIVVQQIHLLLFNCICCSFLLEGLYITKVNADNNNNYSDLLIQAEEPLWAQHDVSGCYLFNHCGIEMPCSCDLKSCFIYRDCCVDVFGAESPMPEHELANSTQCYKINDRQHIFVINACPLGSIKYMNESDTEYENMNFMKRNAPVYSTKSHLTYGNEYLARCNNDYGDHLILFDGYFQNSKDKLSDCILTKKLMNMTDFLSKCKLQYSIPKEAVHVRLCKPDMINSCSPQWISANGRSYISDMCERGGYGPILDVLARNLFCLLCNDYNITYMTCLGKHDLADSNIFSVSLRILLDLSVPYTPFVDDSLEDLNCLTIDNEGTCYPIECRFGYVFSPTTKDCRKQILEIHNIMLNYTIFFTTEIISESNKLLLASSHFYEIKPVLDLHNIIYHTTYFPGHFYKGQNLDTFQNCYIIKFEYRLYVEWPFKSDFESDLLKLAKSDFIFPQFLNVGNATSLKRLSLEDACSICNVNSNESSICLDQSPVLSSDLNPLQNNLSLRNLECPMVKYSAQKLLNIFDKETLKSVEDEYYYDKNGNAYICFQTLRHLFNQTSKVNTLITFGVFEILLTNVTFGFSSISLIVFVLAHCNDKTFKNEGGKCALALAILLFLAQTTFVVSDEFVKWPLACEIIGCVLHFLWNCVFFWMSISAFVLWKYFQFHHVRVINESSFFVRHASICFLLSICVVGPMACLHFIGKGNSDIYYGGVVCFLSSARGILVGIYLPITIMIMICSGFVIHFAYIINKHKQATSTQSKKRNLLLVLMRVASLFGFSWLIGIASSLLENDVLWALFYIFTGLQGFFLAFMFTSRSKLSGCLKFFKIITNSNN